MNIPRLVISGLSGGAGKTLVSLGIARSLSNLHLKVKTFKKGPDYIDAAWLSKAAASPQGNLDPYFLTSDQLRTQFTLAASGYDFAIIEGNRGLFDGLDVNGSCATSALARILNAPVILVVDCTKMTRTAAALVHGCKHFEKGVTIGGVILNKTGTERQRNLIRTAIEDLTGTPVLGTLPRHNALDFEERPTGLANTGIDFADKKLRTVAELIADNIDLEKVLAIGNSCIPFSFSSNSDTNATSATNNPAANAVFPPITIGYINDGAFWSYYQENLDALAALGARLIPLSLLDESAWPKIDGLYFGGGTPEDYLTTLSQNQNKRQLLHHLVAGGLPVYAEGASLVYLCETAIYKNKAYIMSGIIPGDLQWCDRPQGLGYTNATVIHENPFHHKMSEIRAHEFHFWHYKQSKQVQLPYLYLLSKGKGLYKKQNAVYDGLLRNNLHTSLGQIYAPAIPSWAQNFICICTQHRECL